MRQLTWEELDCLLEGQAVRRQKDLIGHRMIAAQVYNALAEKPLKEHEYRYLPAVDGSSAVVVTARRKGWQQRMKEKYGDKLELT